MSDKCVVYNMTKGPVSFGLAVAIDPKDLEGVPSHRRRRVIKANVIQIVIPYGRSVDLVEKTGLPVGKIKMSAELIKLESRGAVRVEVASVEDTTVEEEPKPKTKTISEPEEQPEKKADKKAEKKAEKAKKKAKKKG